MVSLSGTWSMGEWGAVLKALQPPLPLAQKYLPFSDGKLNFEKN